MRILVLTALYPPATGGAATYFSQIVPLLARHEDVEKIVVLTEKMPGETAVKDQGVVTILRLLPTRTSISRRTWVIHALTYVWTQIWFVLFFSRLVRRYEIDLIHFHTRYRGRLLYWTLSRCSLPVLADLRDKMTDPTKFANAATHLICCSRGIYKFAITCGYSPNDCDIVPVAFDPPNTFTTEELLTIQQHYHLSPKPYILFIGDITHNKGIYELLEAFKIWQPNHPDIQLIIAGTNRDGEKFTQKITNMSQISYLGHVPHKETLGLIQNAEILILPSRSEGLPRVILEAISLQTKVICPPNIPEFEQYLNPYILPEVTTSSLISIMESVWQLPAPPNYPLENHAVPKS